MTTTKTEPVEAAPVAERGSVELEARYSSALLWIYDRLSVDDGMTKDEQTHTMAEIKKVLEGEASLAAFYCGDSWLPSSKINIKGAK